MNEKFFVNEYCMFYSINFENLKIKAIYSFFVNKIYETEQVAFEISIDNKCYSMAVKLEEMLNRNVVNRLTDRTNIDFEDMYLCIEKLADKLCLVIGL